MSATYTVAVDPHYAGGTKVPARVITLKAKAAGAAKLIALRRAYDALGIARSVRLKEAKARIASTDDGPTPEADALVERALA